MQVECALLPKVSLWSIDDPPPRLAQDPLPSAVPRQFMKRKRGPVVWSVHRSGIKGDSVALGKVVVDDLYASAWNERVDPAWVGGKGGTLVTEAPPRTAHATPIMA